MFTHFLRLLWRNLRKQRFYAILNILGLALGIIVCMLIVYYIADELNYDKFHTKKESIYRINQTNIWSDEEAPFASTGPNVALAIKDAIPEVETVIRFHTPGEMWVSYEEGELKKTFQENQILAADKEVFDVFSAHFLYGSPDDALIQPYSVVMTASTATRYFGQTNGVGKLITLQQGNESHTYQVTGIVEDWPAQSHFHFDMLISMNSIANLERMEWSWIWTTFVTYVTLKENASYQEFESKLVQLPRTYAVPTLRRVMGITYEQFEAEGKTWELYAQPLTDIHLYSDETFNRLGPEGDIQIVYALAVIALLVLLLSSINYVNLSTASATKRAKDVGVHKVLGSSKRQLSLRFFFESVCYCIIALLISSVALTFILPYFNEISAKQLELKLGWEFLGWAGFAVVLGVLAGLYPARFLSSFQPIATLSGKFSRGKKSQRFRSGLVILQFTVSSLLIVCTWVVADQLSFLQNKDLGFDKDQVLMIHHAESLDNSVDQFRNEIEASTSILHTGLSDSYPPNTWNEDYFIPDDQTNLKLPISYMVVESGFVPTLGIELLAGRDFLPQHTADQYHIILNETAIKQLGWTDATTSPNYAEVLGKQLRYPGSDQHFIVIGVMKDFHHNGLQVQIEPLALFYYGAPIHTFDQMYISARLSPSTTSTSDISQLLVSLETTWRENVGDIPFEYSFVDDDFFASFQSEQRLQAVLQLLTGLAIVIACLGLLGLIAFTVERRQKEMGIRKLFGATVLHIFHLLSLDLLKWVAIGFVISIPLAYVAMSQWLDTFTYRMELSWTPFAFTAGVLLMLALMTMSYHALRSAWENPVNSLKESE